MSWQIVIVESISYYLRHMSECSNSCRRLWDEVFVIHPFIACEVHGFLEANFSLNASSPSCWFLSSYWRILAEHQGCHLYGPLVFNATTLDWHLSTVAWEIIAKEIWLPGNFRYMPNTCGFFLTTIVCNRSGDSIRSNYCVITSSSVPSYVSMILLFHFYIWELFVFPEIW